MDVIKYVSGNLEGGFFVEANANKSLAEFQEHEKHTGFTKDQLKEIHGLIKAEAKKNQPGKVKTDEKPVE